jgi:hypothetical protein
MLLRVFVGASANGARQVTSRHRRHGGSWHCCHAALSSDVTHLCVCPRPRMTHRMSDGTGRQLQLVVMMIEDEAFKDTGTTRIGA